MKMKPVVLPNPCHLPWRWAWVLSCAKQDLTPLPNQTWVHSPNIQQCQHTTYIQHTTTYNDMQQLGCGERKYSVDCKAHSSVLAWRIPGTGEPGGLPSMGSHRVGHDWSDLAAAAARHPRWGQSRTGSSCSKDPNPLMPFRVGFLKTMWGRGSQGLSSACAQFSDWLMGKLTGWFQES